MQGGVHCSQNRTTFALNMQICGCLRLLLSVANTGKVLIVKMRPLTFHLPKPRVTGSTPVGRATPPNLVGNNEVSHFPTRPTR